MSSCIKEPPEGWIEREVANGKHSVASEALDAWRKSSPNERKYIRRRFKRCLEREARAALGDKRSIDFIERSRNPRLSLGPDGKPVDFEGWTKHEVLKGDHISIQSLSDAWENGTNDQRRLMRRKVEKYAKLVTRAGLGDQKAANFISVGRRSKYESAEAALEARAARHHAENAAASKSRHVFRMSQGGCSQPGCPMPEHNGLYCLFENDHVDPKTKTACLAVLTGEARELESKKTRVLCMWHHFLNTRVQMKNRVVQDLPGSRRGVAQWKENTGCQHPCHKNMPYAPLVPHPDDDPLMHGFLVVSHKLRVKTQTTKWAPWKQYLIDLDKEDAVIHCVFCHALWTLLEKSCLFPRPAAHSTHEQVEVLRQRCPEFISHFQATTAGFDWAAEKARSTKQSIETRKGKKRKRE